MHVQQNLPRLKLCQKAVCLTYPADWGSPGADRFNAMGMNFQAVPAGSEGALITELEASIAKKSPYC